jgi:hypothetical protein
LDPVARGLTGGVGGRGFHQSRDGPTDAKKNGMTKRKIQYWVSPPDADGEFVAHMEEVLETYEKAYDPDCPVVCMDEQSVQLIGETRLGSPRARSIPIASTTNMSGTGRRASSCLPSPCQASGSRQRLGHAAPRLIGLTK